MTRLERGRKVAGRDVSPTHFNATSCRIRPMTPSGVTRATPPQTACVYRGLWSLVVERRCRRSSGKPVLYQLSYVREAAILAA